MAWSERFSPLPPKYVGLVHILSKPGAHKKRRPRGRARTPRAALTFICSFVSSQPPITVLPPGPERPSLHFPQHVSSGSKYPVSARFDGHEFESTGLDFGDYSRMRQSSHVLAPNRRYETPEWAVNDALLGKVLVAYIEARASIGRSCTFQNSDQSDRQRIEAAKKQLIANDALLKATVVRLSQEFFSLIQKPELSEEEEQRKRKLNVEIANYSTTMRVNHDIVMVVLGIIYRYYRQGFDARTIADEMHLRHDHVRMVLWRLQRRWEKLGGAKPAKKVSVISRPPRKARHKTEAVGRDIQPVKHIDPNTVAPPRVSDEYQRYVDFCNRLGSPPLPEMQWRAGRNSRA